ncbi:CapA family protein [Patescibacteria group bacterium]|nr:CapA family protein [Patescibacteria group bacterium]MBU2219285.1 CapA family protein [Patescibacteria group bacterium]MBU2263519.1 CapA family protein [Patescibacteria group bacterium]
MIKKFLKYFIAISIAILTGILISHVSLSFLKLSADRISSIFVKNEPASFIASPVIIKEILSKKISMIFVGDIMLDRDIENSVVKNGNGDFSFIFENSSFLKETDIVFGNLEGPVSDIGEKRGSEFSFRMDPIVILALKEAGFNVLSVANNHAGDWGREAFNDTFSRLNKADILAVGAGWNKEDASQVKIIEKNGLKIGFLGFSDIGPKWLKADDNNSGILLVGDDFMEIIKKASSQVDYLIVSIHFGEEYQKEPSERQKQVAKSAINAGAKIIIGHHPHVVQETERYDSGFIVYSLGNFVFDQNFSKETMQGAVLKIILNEKGIIEIKENTVKLNEFYQPSLEEL